MMLEAFYYTLFLYQLAINFRSNDFIDHKSHAYVRAWDVWNAKLSERFRPFSVLGMSMITHLLTSI